MGLRGLLGGGKFGAISRFGGRGGGGSFKAVRSMVNFLGLRGSRAPRIDLGTYLTYTKTWDAAPYLQRLAVSYLEKRPEYNAGWQAMVSNMKNNIINGGYIYGTITKTHTFERAPGEARGSHSVSYETSWNSNLENATNHPDLMSNYIEELEDLFRHYFECYKNSECSDVSSREEWEIRFAALDEYRDFVDETMSESD